MIRSLLALSVLAVALPVAAQSSDGDVADPTVKLRALETMNETASTNLSSSLAHEKELKSFIQANSLTAACDGSTSSDTPTSDNHDMSMSFDKGLEIAIKHEQMAPSHTHVPDEVVARETAAYTNLAKSTWGKLQASMASIQHMSDCLKANGKFQAYKGWSNDQAKTRQQEMDALNAKISKENQEKTAAQNEQFRKEDAAFAVAQKKQHQQFLNTMWTQHKFESNQALKAAKYHTKYGQGSYYNSYGGDRPQGYGGGYGY